MKKILITLALALGSFITLASAQNQQTIPLTSEYDLASTSYIYCVTADNAGNPWTAGTYIEKRITTSGSSTTVTSVSTDAPFAQLAVGDELLFNLDGVMTRRYVATKASSNSMTVNAAVNLGDGRQGALGYTFTYRTRTCGTGATIGWIPVRGRESIAFSFALVTINATSIDAQIQCRQQGSVSPAIEVWTKNYTVAGGDMVTMNFHGGIKYDDCRFGMKVNTDTGAQSITVQVGG